MKYFENQTIVIKCGGETIDDLAALDNVLDQVSRLQRLGAKIILVHGGGTQIKERSEALGISEIKKNGVRVTCSATMAVVEEVLSDLNEKLVSLLSEKSDAQGIGAFSFMTAKQDTALGLVGEPEAIDEIPFQDNKILVVYPVCRDENGNHLNVNADSVASAIAAKLNAMCVVFCTGAAGVWDNDRRIIASLTPAIIENLINQGIVKDGMIKKLRECIALLDYVGSISIAGSAEPDCIINSLSGRSGTLIKADIFQPNPICP